MTLTASSEKNVVLPHIPRCPDGAMGTTCSRYSSNATAPGGIRIYVCDIYEVAQEDEPNS